MKSSTLRISHVPTENNKLEWRWGYAIEINKKLHARESIVKHLFRCPPHCEGRSANSRKSTRKLGDSD